MAITDWIQSLAIVVSILIAAWQLREQSRHSRAAADMALIAKFDEVNKILIEYPETWARLQDEYDGESNDPTLGRLDTVVFMTFNTLELARRHYRKYQLISEKEWPAWEVSVDMWLSKRFVRGWWRTNSREYGVEFREYVDERAAKLS